MRAELLLFLAVSMGAGATHAQSGYPTRAVRMIVPSSAGGGADMTARMIAPKLSERLGQQVIIDNRPGAGTMIGGEMAAKAVPDGYTIMMGISTLAINPAMFKKVPYDALRDFAAVTQVASTPNILVVHTSVPAKSVKELIAFALPRPGQLNFGSAGAGTNPHLSMELFLSMAKLRMEHIAYKGSAPAIVDLLAGNISVMAPNAISTLPHVKTGRLRALGVTGAKRTEAAPEIPTIAEAGLPGYEAVQWYGVVAPAATPRDIISRLQAEIAAILSMPDVKKRFLDDGADTVGSTADEFGRYIKSETEKWSKVVRDAGIKPE